MKIFAKIVTEPEIKIVFEVTGLKPFKSAERFARSMTALDASKSGVRRAFFEAFKEATEGLTFSERCQFVKPDEALAITEQEGKRIASELEALSPTVKKAKKKQS